MKGTAMGKRYWIVGGIVLGVLATVVLAGINIKVPIDVPRWEYGMYITEVGKNGEKRVSWYERREYVADYTPYEFCLKMNIPASNITVEEKAATPTYEVTVFDLLGARGWELVSTPEKDGKRTIYLFKRHKWAGAGA